ncbi:MAG TPA: type I polyketide synthase, partial [Candidatus Xenobia bacterium]
MAEPKDESLDRALLAISRLRARNAELELARHEPVAIIGLACRYPGGVRDGDTFWRLLADGVDGVSAIPPERWRLRDGAEPCTRWAGLLDHRQVQEFDPAFFGIAPREAVSMDPQQRLLLEVTWEALENAGLPADRLVGSRTGVFIGIFPSEYQPTTPDLYQLLGNMTSVAAGRISYVLGLQGPCFALDTACSSSLVAIHLAVNSLRQGECEVALAGGVNLILSSKSVEGAARLQALSPDGRCKTFDAQANGFVRSEGCGIVVLKRLSLAQRDQDRVLAVVRGSAMNQDGRSTGLTAPNVLSQQALLESALSNARVAPESIGYVEAHGTGTTLGDPIEVEALTSVLGRPRADGSPCVLGAVKSNIGHTEAAAGVAGIIKVALALHHEMLPPNVHFRALNPHITLSGTPFVIATCLQPWPRSEKPRRAGVSSFGLSGTNAHVIVEEAPVQTVASAELKRPMLLPLSARTVAALQQSAAEWVDVLQSSDAVGDLLYTAAVRRTHHAHRLAVVGNTAADLVEGLQAFVQGRSHPGLVSGQADMEHRPRVVFVFPGHGSQW